jgi:hypothetical protein
LRTAPLLLGKAILEAKNIRLEIRMKKKVTGSAKLGKKMYSLIS